MGRVTAVEGHVTIDEHVFLPPLKNTTCSLDSYDAKCDLVGLTPDKRYKDGYRTYRLTITAPVRITKTFILKANEIK